MIRMDFSEKKQKFLVMAFFAFFLCVGVSLFKDYGVSCDEGLSQASGRVTINYILHGDPTLLTFGAKHYGTWFDTFLVVLEKALPLAGTTRSIFLMRHLLTFFVFYVGVVFFYKLARYHFKSRKAGLLASLFFIVSPRIFADAFYNPRDIPFMVLCVISLYTLVRYLGDKRSFWCAFSHALACSLLIDTRIPGVLVPCLTGVFMAGDALGASSSGLKERRAIINFLGFVLWLLFFTVLFWPFLWTSPWKHFVEAFHVMSRYPWPSTDFYRGQYLPATQIPWHYFPVWLAITTPLFYSVCFVGGSLGLMAQFLRRPAKLYAEKRNDLVFVAFFYTALAAVIIFKSVLYGGWRHMFFTYPAFLMIAVRGLLFLFEFIRQRFRGALGFFLRGVLIAIILMSLAGTVGLMVRLHPYQNVYFNRLR